MSIDTVRDDNPIDSAEQLSELIDIDADSIDEVALEDIWIAGIPLGKLLSKALQHSKEAKETSEDVQETTESHEQAIKHLHATTDDGSSDDSVRSADEEPTRYRHETPLERLLDDPQRSGIRITESVSRALSIAGHYKQWSNNRSAGHVIIDGLKDLLSTAMGEPLAWKQVHRACHKLDELTNGKIQFTEHHRHGRILVLEDTSWLSRVVSEQTGS
jgi:hypothetical protein